LKRRPLPEKEQSMVWRIVRVSAGFAAAALAAGLVLVFFVVDPVANFATPDGAAAAGVFILLAATQAAYFSLPFALPAILLSETFALRRWPMFVLIGAMIGLAGHGMRIGWPASNTHALTAFLAAGALGGIVYRLVAGAGANISSRSARMMR
jgi:hypothetical protein